MYAQMGMSVLSTASSLDTGRTNTTLANMQSETETKLARMTQSYNRTMSEISKAQQLNAMTSNEVNLRDAAVRTSAAIQQQSMQDRAGVEASAAAAGVRGGSVRSAMNSIQRSKLQARASLRKRIVLQRQSTTQDRANLELSHIFNRDISPYTSPMKVRPPSTASALLGLGANLIDTYDANQPEGSRTTDTIAGWGSS